MSDRDHARFETGDNRLDMQVSLVQPLGDKMDVYLATEHHPHVVAQLDAFFGLETNARLSIYFDLGRVHFFEDGEAGARLLKNPALSAMVSRASVPPGA
jgi:hypothetical protein